MSACQWNYYSWLNNNSFIHCRH